MRPPLRSMGGVRLSQALPAMPPPACDGPLCRAFVGYNIFNNSLKLYYYTITQRITRHSVKNPEKNLKKILPVQKLVVILHSLSGTTKAQDH